ncbi:MAG TPA: hypothetical protein VD789_10600 [Thermomicrobiales bacterium]|nr:hypothetical protein [Thermomicrobiales bacterium]
MTEFRIDRILSLFRKRRADRRTTTEQRATPALAQEAAPAAADPDSKPATLFVQSFQAGSLTPSATYPDRLTVTLEHGLGQTVVFSDRPARNVAALSTRQILDTLGFPPDNPPNAAMILETAPGESEITVVELFDPVYDEDSATLAYDIVPLASWHDSADFGFTSDTLDAASLPGTFGSAHVFIDDCAQGDIICMSSDGNEVGRFDNDRDLLGWVYDTNLGACIPWRDQPSPSTTKIVLSYANQCNIDFDECMGDCDVAGPAPYFNYLR